MSGPYQHPPFSASNPNSPLSPQPRGNTPVSFRTNVNRAKTRRWVEAKKYSYDGDDWGEDEYGEYEYDDDQSASQALQTSANQSTADSTSAFYRDPARPPLPSMDSSRSMDGVQTIPEERENAATPSNPQTPIVRPVDIYKRMREEQKAHQVSAEPSTEELTSAVCPSTTSPPTGSAAAETSERSALLPAQIAGSTSEIKSGNLHDSTPAPPTANEPPPISLPDVNRLSAFNPDFFPGPESNTQNNQDPTSQPHQLQHNPSLGFRSAVNQAFDVPETPSTTADSIARSNSDSTTGISPVIARRGMTDETTPTIQEEPNENVDSPSEGNIAFKPGHRRDLSLPSPGNSPSRKPVINESENASSVLAQISTGTPSGSPQDIPPSSQQQFTDPNPTRPSQETSERDLPAPLNVQTNVAPGPAVTTENVPVIIPSMSTEHSPEDTENDRLRKEIIRSLSQEDTPSDQEGHDTPPQPSRQDSLIPREYESYWNEQQTAGAGEHGSSTSRFDSAPVVPEAHQVQPIAHAPPQGAQPKLQRRFSWEESSDDEEPTPTTQEQPHRLPPMPGQYPLSQENIYPEPAITPSSQLPEQVDHVGVGNEVELESPKLTVVPPSPAGNVSIPSSGHSHESVHSQTTETLANAEEGQSVNADQLPPEPPAPTSSASIESGLLGFKDILGIKSSDERVRAFNRTRDQFAAIDTGLGHWVQVTLHAHPEHSDIIERNSIPLGDFKPSATRAKFPKLASLGNLASSLQDGTHSTSGHIRRPSVPLGSMKQHQVGKDFLHTAGVLGGQAGKAAKGFFSKGRSKLKGSGSTEKGFQSMRGYHRPVRLSDLQPDAESSLDLEDHQDLHGYLWSRPWAANRNDDTFTTKGREELFVRLSPPDVNGQFGKQRVGQQRPTGSNDPIEGQGEPRQRYSRSPSKNESADCQRVDHLSAIPRDDFSLKNVGNDDNSYDNNKVTLSRGKRPSHQSQTQIFNDIRHHALHQLPSVSSLGVQEADLDPPPPLTLKLAQNNSSSQVSLPSDLGDSQPRHRGGSIRACGERASQGHNSITSESPLAQCEAFQTPPALLNGHPSSTAGLLLLTPSSVQHDRSRRPEQISSPRDPASHRNPYSHMEKLKNVGRFRRISMGSDQPDFKAGRSPKKPFNRLTGLFIRNQHRKSGARQQAEGSTANFTRHHLRPPPRPDSRMASPSISSSDNPDRPVSLPDGRNPFQGQRPPLGTYFAHESPETFSVTQSQEHVDVTTSSDRMRLSDPTPTNLGRLSPRSHPYHSSPTPQHQHHISSPRLSSPVPSPVPRTPPSRGRSEERTYAEDLQLRSRSPKFFAPRPEERNLPKHDTTDPAFRLGTFRSNPRTSRIGDQELPWKITIPGDFDDTRMDASSSWRQEIEGVLNGARLPAYQEDTEEHGQSSASLYLRGEKREPPLPNPPPAAMNTSYNTQPNSTPNLASPEHPHRSGARAINSFDTPVELSVRTDDDSREEIMMSSTAYPGQEWRPLGFSEWEHL